jgi:hypothetical protein
MSTEIELKVGGRYLVDQRETYYVEINVIEISNLAVHIEYPLSKNREWVKKDYFKYNKVVEELPTDKLANRKN